jgi:large subunit ribosomal protein L16
MKTKYNKVRRKLSTFSKHSLSSVATRNSEPLFGSFGLQILSPVILNTKHIETIRRIASSSIKKNKSGELFQKIHRFHPVTKKSLGSRMGSGKASVSHTAVPLMAGSLLQEYKNINFELANSISEKVSSKLKVKTRIIKRRSIYA